MTEINTIPCPVCGDSMLVEGDGNGESCEDCHMLDVIDTIPEQPQRQDSLTDQLSDLRRVAIRLGMYDAYEFLARRTP